MTDKNKCKDEDSTRTDLTLIYQNIRCHKLASFSLWFLRLEGEEKADCE